MPPSHLSPEARRSRILGAVALVFAILSVALVWLAVDPQLHPYIVLAIPAFLMFILVLPVSVLAMVLGRRARRRASLEPGAFRAPGAMGSVLGLLAMGVWALVLLMMVPFLAGRGGSPRARDRAVVSNMHEGLAELSTAFEKAAAEGLAEEGRLERLDVLMTSWQDRRNPWSKGQPWLHPHLLVSGPGEAAAEGMARQRAVLLGQSVFVISSAASDSGDRWMAGAVLTQGREDSSPRPVPPGRIISKTARLRR